MSDAGQDAQPSPQVLDTAARILHAALGGSVRLGAAQKLPGSKRACVFRVAVVDGSHDVPYSVVIKQINPDVEHSADQAQKALAQWTFYNDWASLRFLNDLADANVMSPLAPRLYGGDVGEGVFVMEDLGTGLRLDHYLLGADPRAAETALVDYATSHALLHGLTYGRRGDFLVLRKALGSAKVPDDHYRFDWLASAAAETADAVGITPDDGVEADLAALASALREPGPFFTFTQGDACPDNCIRVDGALRLLDFEGGGFGHALAEGVYGRMRFPTCWCVGQMPESVVRAMEAAYRTELTRWIPEAGDDRLYFRTVTEACVHWVLDWFHSFPLQSQLERDQTWRMGSVRQRTLVRLVVAARATQEYKHLAAIGEMLDLVRLRLETLWAGDVDPMDVYPAFGHPT